MKLNRFLIVSAIASLVFSAGAQASGSKETSDIVEGKTYKIEKHGQSVAYFKEGMAGEVSFTCNLTGDHVNAILYPTKNFFGNLPHVLEAGNNGPYVWKLHDMGYDFGKIKIKLIRGHEAIVQCRQVG